MKSVILAVGLVIASSSPTAAVELSALDVMEPTSLEQSVVLEKDSYRPPDNGGPTTSQGSGTR